MSLLRGKEVKTEEEAVSLAFQDAGAADMAHTVPALFRWAVDHGELQASARAVIGRAVRGEYGKGSRWWMRRLWYVPIPRLSYTREGVACLKVNVGIHLVANVEIEAGDYIRNAAVVGQVGKAKTALLPLPLLLAVPGGDLNRFRIVAKDGPWTTFEIPGTKPVTLHDAFLNGLSEALGKMPVDRLLQRFGSQSTGVIPLVVEDLLGLVTGGRARHPHLDLKAIEELVVTRMGYSLQKARELMGRADLRADDSEEDALRKVLTQADERG